MRPSARLLNAVAAERAELDRQRASLQREAADLRAQLQRIEQGMAEIDAQCGLLERLAPHHHPQHQNEQHPPQPPTNGNALKGPAIRQRAVKVLLDQGLEGLHYREWFELLLTQGHDVAGKDPLAVFLTQLTRSPVLRKSAIPGHYELDKDATQRLTRRLERLQNEYPRAQRQQRTRLTAEIARTERQLDEALSLLPEGAK